MPTRPATPVTFFPDKYGQPLAIDASSFPSWTGIVRDGEPHVLDFHEFLVISGGQADIVVGDRAIRITEPSVVFTPPNVVRRVEVSDPLQLELVVFCDTALRRSGWQAALRGLAPGLLSIRDTASLRSLVSVTRLMTAEVSAPRPDSPMMLDALLAQFLITMNRSRGAAVAAAPALAIRFERLLERRYPEDHAVAPYAAALGVTSDHLSAVIRSHYGISAKAMIDRRIFAEATRLLVCTPRSIADIGAALGFDEPSHFSRAFKRACGQAPQRLRGGH